MDPLAVVLVISLWGLIVIVLTGGAALAALFLVGVFKFLRWCFTVTYRPRRR
jgi:hypothetical protein